MIKEEIPEFLFNRVKEAKQNKIEVYPCHVNRASALGHPCERYLVYMRLNWDKQDPHTWEVQSIFDIGKDFEELVISELKEAGIDIIQQQLALMIKKPKITGHIDCKVQIDGIDFGIPAEIKSMSPYTWNAIKSIDSMFSSKYVYLRKYPAQLQIYLLADEKEFGLFILKNKVSGQYKFLTMDLDYEFAESLLKKAERVDEYVELEEYPDKLNETDVCLKCPFKHICLPDIGMEGEALEGEALESICDEYVELDSQLGEKYKEKAKRYKEVKDIIRAATEGKPSVRLGKYLIRGIWVEGEKAGHRFKYWKIKNITNFELIMRSEES